MALPRPGSSKPSNFAKPTIIPKTLSDVDIHLEALRAARMVAVDRADIAEFDRTTRELDRILDVRLDLARTEKKAA